MIVLSEFSSFGPIISNSFEYFLFFFEFLHFYAICLAFYNLTIYSEYLCICMIRHVRNKVYDYVKRDRDG